MLQEASRSMGIYRYGCATEMYMEFYEFCKKFTVNEKWLKEIDVFKPSSDITSDQYKMVAEMLGLSSFGKYLMF